MICQTLSQSDSQPISQSASLSVACPNPNPNLTLTLALTLALTSVVSVSWQSIMLLAAHAITSATSTSSTHLRERGGHNRARGHKGVIK